MAVFGLPLLAGDQALFLLLNYPSVRAGWLQRQQREGTEPITLPFRST
jgi:hypothetical protein